MIFFMNTFIAFIALNCVQWMFGVHYIIVYMSSVCAKLIQTYILTSIC